MGADTGKVLGSSLFIFKMLVLSSNIISIVISISYLIILLYPQIFFTGYIHGYISLTRYELYYNINGCPIELPNLDMVRAVSFTAVIHTFTILFLNILSLLTFNSKPLTSVSIAYGSSLSLIVSSGVLKYLSQVFLIDAGRIMQYANNGPFRFKTLAGIIEYPGITADKTIANVLLFTYPWLITLLLYYSMILSVAAVVLEAWKSSGKPIWHIKSLSLFRKKCLSVQFLALIILMTNLFYNGASTFAYYTSEANVTPTPPPITFNPPPYSYTCTSLLRTSRVAIAYTDFETYPISGWTANGGTWSSVSGVAGSKGNVLQGSDNNGGAGGASQYYYSTSLSGYSSLWVVAKTRFVSGTGYYGVSMINTPRNRMYTVEIYTGGTFVIRSYNVETGGAWHTLASTTIPGYSATSWYIIAVNYNVTTMSVNIMARIYNSVGNLLTSVSASSTSTRRFSPAYIGVGVNDLTAYFDDFLIATSDPRSVYFSGLTAGMIVELWDNLGNLVASGTTTGATLSLNVVHDVVVGTGIDGRIVVKYPDGFPCIVYRVPSTSAILGGDVYQLISYPLSVTLGVNKTSTVISALISASPSTTTIVAFIRVINVDTKPYYARVFLSPLSNLDQLTANISIVSGAPVTNITIVNGMIISHATSWITIQPGTTINLVLSAYFPSPGNAATLYMFLEYCTLPGEQGVCVYYPIRLDITATN